MNELPFIIKKHNVELFHLEDLVNNHCIDLSENYCPFKLTHLQTYNPIYSKLFQNDGELFNTGLNNRYQFVNMNQVLDTTTGNYLDKSVFIKFSPLLDPLRYMVGKYNKTDYDKLYYLPNDTLNNTNTPDILTGLSPHKMTREQKLNNSNNASYIDCFFNFLSSQLLNNHRVVNGIHYYGSYLCIQDKFKMNIYDDYEYVQSFTFFNNKLNQLFNLNIDEMTHHYINNGSRNNKTNIKIDNLKPHNISIISTISLSDSELNNNNCEDEIIEQIYEKLPQTNSSTDTIITTGNNISSSTKSSNDSELNYSSSDEDETETEPETDEDTTGTGETSTTFSDCSDTDDNSNSSISSSNSELFVYIYNFPVQMICLEKCDGTLDELFDNGFIYNTMGISILMQIIMTLIIYQKLFNFTHNDLHTNNIMYVNTNIEYLYYTFNKKMYKVPTYGKIFKIIDFGRSIYTFQNKLYCSDSFAPDGDAATQYNFEPYLNCNKPIINPNYSFDLCRLACSIYEYIINDEDTFEDMDNFQKIIYNWCTDDNNKNILYKKNGDERYPNFKLYKMIARTVHKHIPKLQLNRTIFKQFVCKNNKPRNWNESHVNIDDLPVYV